MTLGDGDDNPFDRNLFNQTCGEDILNLSNLENRKQGEEKKWNLEKIIINPSSQEESLVREVRKPQRSMDTPLT